MSPKLKPSFISIFSLNTDSFQNLQYINTDYGLKTHQNLIKKTRLSSRFSIDFSVFDHIIRFKPDTLSLSPCRCGSATRLRGYQGMSLRRYSAASEFAAAHEIAGSLAEYFQNGVV